MIQLDFEGDAARELIVEIDTIWRLSRRDAKNKFRWLTALRDKLQEQLQNPTPPEAA